MKYIHTKDFAKMISNLMQRGGNYQKAAGKVAQVLGLVKLEKEDPLMSLPVTHSGETRIKHCVKYDLPGRCRLITVQNNGFCFFVYLGDHDESDWWLEQHKGWNPAIDTKNNQYEVVFKSEDLAIPQRRIADGSDYFAGNLIQRLGIAYFEKIASKIPYRITHELQKFDETADEESLLQLALKIDDQAVAYLVFDTFTLVKSGKIDEAKNRILEYESEIKLLEKANSVELANAKSNNFFQNTVELSDDDIQILMNGKSWLDWMLFMHPDQGNIVKAKFSGSSRLLGVSGSGKTAIIVRRAVELAKRYSNERILILTLNRSLSTLIQQLLDIHSSSLGDHNNFRKRITVCCYWEVCRDLLLEFETDQWKRKSLSDFSDKHKDSIDEVWREYYRREENNDTAQVLSGVHQMLLQRGIFPESYIKQEFDWVRSALAKNEHDQYLQIERDGRAVPLQMEYRVQILRGLAGWEELMDFVGVIDYLGMTQKLIEIMAQIKPRYRCILVDEIQDFGTLELKVIRALAQENEDDIFLSGDIAQQVYTKHHKITQAGIRIVPSNYLTIKKNYRNSREILAAAFEVFRTNTSKASYHSEDFEVLDPEFANFSSPKPFLRKTSTLSNEFNFALSYLREQLSTEQTRKGCIAICGYSYYDIQRIGKDVGIPVLDGQMELTDSSIFLSDLEQTKGFEFDRMIIINCNEDVIPDRQFPAEEWFRDISKLYVAMTRAKYELILSYSSMMSSIFNSSNLFFTHDEWVDHLTVDTISKFNLPRPSTDEKDVNFAWMTGEQLLYTRTAMNLSVELQTKLRDLVNGKHGTDEKGQRFRWRNMGDLITDLNTTNNTPNIARRFGPSVYQQLLQLLKDSKSYRPTPHIVLRAQVKDEGKKKKLNNLSIAESYSKGLISKRLFNIAMAANIGDLNTLSQRFRNPHEVRSIKNVGVKTVAEVEELLLTYEIS
jgi:hypothetical protein